MEALYQTTTKNTYEEYKKACRAISGKKNIILIIILTALIFFAGYLMNNFVLYIAGVFYPALLFLIRQRQIRNTYNSTKAAHDVIVTYKFYDTYFTSETENSQKRCEYENLYKIIETKTNIYLMLGKNQGDFLKKENFPDGLTEFLRNIKKEFEVKK